MDPCKESRSGAVRPGGRRDGLVDAVLAWGGPRLRDLPWRHTRDPWAVLVSEVMLQQTQAARVVPAWRAFLDRFPDPGTCAAAPLGDVLRQWQGMGYPRRARNLHATAARVVDDHGGRVPDDLDALLALPGIGPYTARAVLAFAYEHDVAVVDTNIARILARTEGVRLTPKRAQTAADPLVPEGLGWTWNQVLMDLGATVCRPTPRCDECPARLACAWALAGRPEPDPAIGSAGVSTRQAPFEGSRRQARGRVLRALADAVVLDGTHGTHGADGVTRADGPDAAGGVPADGFDADVVESLVADGLVVRSSDGTLRLP